MRGPRMAGLGMIAVCLACTPAQAASTTMRAPRALETIVQDDALFLHRPRAEVAATAQRLRSLGADRVRITASWSSIAPDADSDQTPTFAADDPAGYDQAKFASLDVAVREATAAGLRVLIDIGFWAPRWAADATDGPRARTNIDPKAFADFAVAVARRYSGSFTPPAAEASPTPPSEDQTFLDELFGTEPESPPPAPPDPGEGPLPRADALVLWNEPNHPAFMTPTWEKQDGVWVPASPHAYRAMVTAAYPAVKAARSDVTVLIGNTSSTGGRGGGAPVPPLAFLRTLACVDKQLEPTTAGGCRSFTKIPGDGWAHHPYALAGTPRRTGLPKEPDSVYLGDLVRMRELLGKLAASGRVSGDLRNIWLTEMGYETHDGGAPRGVTQTLQARYLPWSEYEASRVKGVKTFAQFLLRDVPPAATAQSDSTKRPLGQFASGLERTDGTPKLAVTAFRAGLVAIKRPKGRVLLWVRTRGTGKAGVRIERRVGKGRWTRVVTFTTSGRGAISRTVRDVKGAQYRVVIPRRKLVGTPTPAV